MSNTSSTPAPPPRVTTGVPGLDEIVAGGWPAERLHMVLGTPGAGKTTLGLQFLLEGAARGETSLYVSLTETAAEVTQVAASHGWTLDALNLFELDAAHAAMGLEEAGRSMFDPVDVELRQTSQSIFDEVRRLEPRRVVLDSLSELELMAGSALVFRRQLLQMKRLLMEIGATALLLSDSSAPEAELQIQSLVHGILRLEHHTPDYGAERRRLRVSKLRGTKFRSGFHDFDIVRGGVRVYPRLDAREHERLPTGPPFVTGLPALNELIGEGLGRGTSTLIMGPAGAGKSSLTAQLLDAAVDRGEKAAVFLFEESRETFLDRADALGMHLGAAVEAGNLLLTVVNPAELSPGEFSHRVRRVVEEEGVGVVAIDSLNGYVYAMPEERFLALHVHELLAYLRQRDVVTLLVMAQHGLVGHMQSPADVTYVADALLLMRFFEAGGRVRRGVSMLKNRAGYHETAIRELTIDRDGIQVGDPLTGFHGVLGGIPEFVGEEEELMEVARDDA